MKNIFLKSTVLLITMMTLLSSAAFADRDHRGNKSESNKQKKFSSNLRFDKRYSHNHAYPREGYTVKTLPRQRRPIHYKNRDYFYINGVWHLSSGVNFVVVRPPLGIIVPILPPFYTTIWVHRTPYYYANDVYYVWRPEMNGYEVTAPPTAEGEPEVSYLADEIFAYPKNNQSKEQQADDRYACHRWGVDKTGYDPTQPPQNLSVTELSEQRERYNRAMKTCLEGKNYSVR